MKQGPPRHSFVKELIIGFGFFSGLWMHLGFSLQGYVFNQVQSFLLQVQPNYSHTITLVFIVLPIVITSLSVIAVFSRGGWLGIVGVGLAFYAGLTLNTYSLIWLGIAVLIGYFATKRKR